MNYQKKILKTTLEYNKNSKTILKHESTTEKEMNIKIAPHDLTLMVLTMMMVTMMMMMMMPSHISSRC